MDNKDEIIIKTEEIIDYIKKSDLYINYENLVKKLENNQEIKKLIADIKNYQKDIIRNPSLENELDLKIKDCLYKLESYPLYNEFINLQNDINNMVNIFENKLNHYFFDVFN